ncbi:hypothetical protein KAR91_80755 [Candidatus Pacearchaeota archaeon]|nr:hypothetical protein [Candidatus Pacearchaeota archaeon]
MRKISYDREFKGITPSAAGTGPRNIWLKATCDYAVDPNDRVFAVLGTTIHGRLSDKGITVNVLSEEPLSDAESQGIADLLEADEQIPGKHILTDYKSSGSFAVAKWLGIQLEKYDVPIIDPKTNKPAILKSGPNKGKVKTKQASKVIMGNPEKDKRSINLQCNRYRIFYEKTGFPISKLQVFAIPRDGNTYIAKNRGIDRNMYTIPIVIMDDDEVLNYYRKLQAEVDRAFEDEWARICEPWECWSGNRCATYCEVREDCQDLCLEFDEKWPGKGKGR